MQFLRQANQFEKLAEILRSTAKTKQDNAIVQVAEGRSLPLTIDYAKETE